MTQHLATFNKIPFTKGGYSGTKSTKIVFVFGWGFAPGPAGEIRRFHRGPIFKTS